MSVIQPRNPERKVDTEKLKEQLLASPKPQPVLSKDLLSTGSTLVNLACSGRACGGFIRGHYHLVVGDSNAGKSWLGLSAFAEATLNPHFDDFRFIYDNVEDGALMDLGRFFGPAVAERLEPPRKGKKGEVGSSSTIEEFYYHFDDAYQAGKPFIYILDSMDGLTSVDEEKKFQEHKKAFNKQRVAVQDEEENNGKKPKGSYGDGKAKKNASGIRQGLHKLKETGSILIVITQTKDNIGFDSFLNPKTRSGGRSLTFYATIELWLAIREKIKKHVKGKDRQLGVLSRIHVKRTRVTGREHTVDVPIYNSHGIDDTGSCIDWLLEEKHWKKKEKETDFAAPEFKFKGSREELVQKIEQGNREGELQTLVEKVWQQIEAACAVERKNKYQ